MTDLLSKQETGIPIEKEENTLKLNEVLEKLKTTFGKYIYESLIKNVNLK